MTYHRLSLSSAFNLSLLSFLLASPVIQADEMPPMDSANMQNMMLKMNQMQACLSNIDPEAFHRAEQAMYQAHATITDLCQQQKRGLAQQEAIRFSQFIQQSKTIHKIDLCSQPMYGLVPSMPLMRQASNILSKQNICDVMAKP